MSQVCQYGSCRCEARYIVHSAHSKQPMKFCFQHALEVIGPEESAQPMLDQIPNVQLPPNLDDKLRKLHETVYGHTTESNWRACRSNWIHDAQWLAKYNKP